MRAQRSQIGKLQTPKFVRKMRSVKTLKYEIELDLEF